MLVVSYQVLTLIYPFLVEQLPLLVLTHVFALSKEDTITVEFAEE
jgi:hypothetical protein